MSEVSADSVVADHRSIGVADRASSYVVGAADTAAVSDPTRNQYQAFLDQVPSDWEIRPLGEIAGIVGGGTPSRDCKAFWNGDIPWVTPGEVSKEESKHMASTNERITSAGLAGSGANLLPIGALMVTTRATLGARAIASVPMATNQGFKSLVFPSINDADFYFYLTPKFKPELVRRASGTTFLEISSREFARIEVPCPPRQEKYEITGVLDTLDTTIRQTEAIIAKLKQVKQGLLHDLLTRGINANGELRPPQSEAPHLYKPSPLGWIPKGWDAQQLREVAVLVTSGSRGWATHYVDAGALFVRSQNVRMGFLDFADRQHVAPPPGSEGQRTKLEGCDLLITITGNSVGNVAYVPGGWLEVAFVSQHVGLVRLRDPSFSILAAHYFVQGAPGGQQLIDAQYGQSKPGLNLENLRDLRVPCPSGEERALIVERIASADKRIETEGRYLEQLSEFKQGLMDDLLTGRVRVTALLDAANTP